MRLCNVRYIKQKRMSVASNHVDGSTQITRSGVIRDRHRGNQAADHIDGSRVRLSRYPVTGRNYARICAAGGECCRFSAKSLSRVNRRGWHRDLDAGRAQWTR
jgi:hypothetical protein